MTITSNSKTRSQIFKTIAELTQIIKQLQSSSNKMTILKQRNKLIITELETTIQTNTLSKLRILNSLILDIEEIKQIISEEKINVTISDLIDVQYPKYLKGQKTCKLLKTIAAPQTDGKLIIEDEIIICESKFYSVQFCKIK